MSAMPMPPGFPPLPVVVVDKKFKIEDRVFIGHQPQWPFYIHTLDAEFAQLRVPGETGHFFFVSLKYLRHEETNV